MSNASPGLDLITGPRYREHWMWWLPLRNAWPSIRTAHRRTSFTGFRLQIYLDLPDKGWVVAIAHLRRRPGYWKDRL